MSTLMHFYGRDDVPLGAYKGPWAANPRAPGAKGTADKYVPDLVGNYPSPVKNSSQVPTATEVYRRVLAARSKFHHTPSNSFKPELVHDSRPAPAALSGDLF